MNYSQFLNLVSSQRKPSPIRLLTALKVQSGPSMISLAGGNPNPLLFPFKEATFRLRGGKVIHLNEDKIKVALQYDASPGNANFVKLLKKIQEHYHKPPLFGHSNPDSSTDLCVTYGSMDGLAKSFDMLVCPGDGVLVEEPSNPMVLSALRPLGCDILPVKMDEDGIVPESLLETCRKFSQNSLNRLKFLYTIPNGQIPTGVSTSVQRKREVYKIARQFEFLILEHDPYYPIQYGQSRNKSYLSIDEDGRVLRFDSFSTLLSPGMRVGYVTGPKALIDRIVLHLMVSSMHVSTLSQVLIYELLNELGPEGLETHIENLTNIYKDRRDATLASADRWLKGVAEWRKPDAGVCLWLKLKSNSVASNDLEKFFDENSCLTSGDKFCLNSQKFGDHLLVTFGDHSAHEIDEAFQNLSERMK